MTKYLPFLLFLVLSLALGCEKPAPFTARDQYVAGERLYNTYCASCHEIDHGIGPRLSKDVVATRVNAQLLFNYNKRNMPYEAGNTLSDSAYWSITAFMLMRDGFLAQDQLLSEENAAEVLLTLR